MKALSDNVIFLAKIIQKICIFLSFKYAIDSNVKQTKYYVKVIINV